MLNLKYNKFSFYKILKKHLLDFDPSKDYYKILGVNQAASEKEIKDAYYKLAKRYHPDLNQGKTTDQFKEMTAAYDILSSSDKRKQYDSSRSFGTFFSGKQYSSSSGQQSRHTYNTGYRSNQYTGDFRDDPFYKNFENMFRGFRTNQQDYKSNFRDSHRMNLKTKYYQKNKDYFSTFKTTNDDNIRGEAKQSQFSKKYFEKNKRYYETFKTDGSNTSQGNKYNYTPNEQSHGQSTQQPNQMSAGMYFILTFFGIFLGSILVNSLFRGPRHPRPSENRYSAEYSSDPYRK
jgi:curved DNA-binding protein CbpA